mmetsp:Transcript_23642/g.65607  ORF Transcript_23642/g.65607 Transcript_23642/m.65607 type:complete len:320 (+) Transcript_23642:1177-2136(+)
MEERIGRTPIRSHVSGNDAVHQHVGPVFEFDPKSVGRSRLRGVVLGLSSGIARCVRELIVACNNRQDLGFPGKRESRHEVARNTAYRTVVDTGRSPKWCVVIRDPIGGTTGAPPGSKGGAVHNVRLCFPLRVPLPIPIGDVDASSGRSLEQLFEIPNVPAMPRQEFGRRVRQRGHTQMNGNEFIVQSRVFHLYKGVQVIVLFLASQITPRSSKARVAVSCRTKGQERCRPVYRQREEYCRSIRHAHASLGMPMALSPMLSLLLPLSLVPFSCNRHCPRSFRVHRILSRRVVSSLALEHFGASPILVCLGCNSSEMIDKL